MKRKLRLRGYHYGRIEDCSGYSGGRIGNTTLAVLWKSLVEAPAVAMPAVYDYKGKQYVVFTVGGNSILTPRVSDEIVAFALPN